MLTILQLSGAFYLLDPGIVLQEVLVFGLQ